MRNVLSLVACALLPASVLTACASGGAGEAEVVFQQTAAEPEAQVKVLDESDPSAASIASTKQLFERSDIAFVAAHNDAESLADDAARLRAPMLIAGNGVRHELERLGVRIVIHPDGELPGEALGDLGDVETVSVDPNDVDDTKLPTIKVQEPAQPAVLVEVSTGGDGDVRAVAAANVQAAGGESVKMVGPLGDPRATSESVATAKAHAESTVLAIGDMHGAEEQFPQRFRTAATQPELPGGGQLALQNRLLIADYGTPGTPALGVMGEQDLDGAVEQVKARAAQYDSLVDAKYTVVPTFEIITTVASASKGDGDYSDELSVDALRPWVERAAEEGIYVVLDLQPGNDDFLTQAKQYEALLKLPHVGLAIDPEWRLKPGQRHLEQIGTVTAAEVNRTLDWLAALTAEHELPQKVVVLHQFRNDMITERDTLDTSHDELALLIHVDGHGTPGDKAATWDAIREDLPEGVYLGWKNFIDEDQPMLTPAQTAKIEPRPSFVSYQ
ncbi:hypothetical protein [Gulosibacter bifidus]|uniref:Lipoprotein n=1 Tax=Gulosibacter bifidus TaxID=272239 RepID=A0ABW5RJQ0_9MICO|nr:hypothetical protein [Gulosibacter bifidus]